jgi:hypothetical protein
MGYQSTRAYEKGVPLDDILRGNARGFAAMYFVRQASGPIGTYASGIVPNVAAHAVAGGIASEIAGGDFRSGALSGGFGALFAPVVPQDLFWGSLASGAIGCGAAAVGGGQCNGTTFAIAGIGFAANHFHHNVMSQRQRINVNPGGNEQAVFDGGPTLNLRVGTYTTGLDGIRLTVDWRPLSVDGTVLPSTGSGRPLGKVDINLIYGVEQSFDFQAPYSGPVRWIINVPPQAEYHGNPSGTYIDVYQPR